MPVWKTLEPLRALGRSLLASIVAAGALGIAEAGATTVALSTNSSNPAMAAGVLSATLDFVLSDPTTLQISLVNDSAFDVQGIYFNTLSNVTGLSLLTGPESWKLETPANKGHPTDTGAFGVFDYVVWVKGKKAKSDNLAPGATGVFEISILGAGPFGEVDFSSQASEADGGRSPRASQRSLAMEVRMRSVPRMRRSPGASCWLLLD